MIVGEIRRYLRDSCALKVGRSTKDLAYRALTAKEELKRSGSEPDNAAIAEYLGCSEKDVDEALGAISDPEGDSWIDGIALKEALRHCTKREAEILRIRYYNGKTQTEAAMQAGVSQAQISRIEKSALQKLRKYMT